MFVLRYLCADLVYVILFPQLLCVVYMESTNTYGCLTGYAVGFAMRILGGEPLLEFEAPVKFPWYENGVQVRAIRKAKGKFPFQKFPFRTLAMILSLATIVFVSLLADWLFT